MTHRLFLALALSLAASGVMGADEKPTLTINATPRLQSKWIGDPYAKVELTVTIKNADEKWWCSGIFIFWGDDSTSSISQTCKLFEEADPVDIRSTTLRRTNKYRLPGRYTIVVLVGKGEEVFSQQKVQIEIKG